MALLKDSTFLRWLEKTRQCYLSIEERASCICLNSFTHRLIERVIKSIKAGFRFSIFGRMTQIHNDIGRDFFQTSRILKVLLNEVRSLRSKTFRFCATSNSVDSIKRLKHDFFSRPLNVGGITIITAIMVNVFLLIILQKDISLWGWGVRILLILLGMVGMFSEADWLTLKTGSIFFSSIGKHGK